MASGRTNLLIILTALTFSVTAVIAKQTDADKCESFLVKANHVTYEMDPESGLVAGLGQEGLKKLISERAKIKQIYDVSTRTVFDAKNFVKGIMLAQISGYNTMIHGGPGAAKTLIVELVNGRSSRLWIKQVAEDTKRIELLGGLTLDGASRGQEEVNFDGSLVKSEFALIDEIEKAQPGLLTLLFSLFHPNERSVQVQGKRIKAALRSVIVASNLTVGALVNKFITNGQEGSGLAFLNRLQMKFRMPNWLQEHFMLAMVKRTNMIEALQAAASIPGAAGEKARARLKQGTPPSDTEWVWLEFAAKSMFTFSDEAESFYTSIANQYAERIRQVIKQKSQETQNQFEKHYPTAEMTSRLVNEIPRLIKASVLLDLLLSDLTDEQLKQIMQQPIELTKTSIWRAFWMLTSVGPGETRLNLSEGRIDYNISVDGNGDEVSLADDYLAKIARDQTEVDEVAQIRQEMDDFNAVYSGAKDELQKLQKELAKLMPVDDDGDRLFKVKDIEALIAKHRPKR